MARFLHRFLETAGRVPDAVAYLEGDSVVTVGTVEQLSAKLAGVLQIACPRPLAVVGVLAAPSARTAAAMFGVLRAGKVFLGLDPTYPPERLRHMVRSSHCDFVLVDPDTDVSGLGPIRTMRISDAMHGEAGPLATAGLDDPNLPAYVTFTSGSTGPPKPVLAPVSQVDNRFDWMWHRYPFEAGDVSCQRMPLSFVDTVWELLGPVCVGSPVALVPAKRFPLGEAMVAELAYRRVTRIWMLPAAINLLLRTVSDLGARLPTLKFWVTTGDAITPGVITRFFSGLPDARLFNLYGTSEAWDATWQQLSREHSCGLDVPVGAAIDGVETFIVDTHGAEVPSGTMGEICIGGGGLASGYIGSQPGTHIDFRQELRRQGTLIRAYRTGDYGYQNGHRTIVYQGRETSWVSRQGTRVSLLAIEAAMSMHPDVAECAAAEDPAGNVVCYYCAEQRTNLSDEVAMEHLRALLHPAALPDRLVSIPSFPMTPSGKIDRRILHQR